MQETNYENEDFLEENNHEQLIVLNPSEAKLEMRLDVFLASELGITRNYAQKLISSGNIRITDFPVPSCISALASIIKLSENLKSSCSTASPA